MEGFPYSTTVQVRWRDLDPFDHVNNAVTVSYLEMARVALWRERLGGRGIDDIPFVVARVEVDYRSPVELYDGVEVGLGVSDLGRSSFALAYRVEAAGRVAAEAVTVQVVVDRASGRPAPIPSELRARLAALSL